MKPLANPVGGPGAPLRPLEITSHIVEPTETILANFRSAVERNLPTIHIKPAHLGKWVICAGGPSLKGELKEIRKRQRRGEIVVSVNGTHDFLLDHGIKPDVFVMVDPKQANVRFVRNPQKEITYYIGACCHQDIFDALKDHDLKVWYPIQNVGEEEIIKYTPVQVGGGSTVGLRAINLGYVLGFREFHLYGFDGCLKGDAHHAYKQPENDGKDVLDVHFLGTTYYCQVWMAKQAQDFIDFMEQNHKEMRIKVHTKGLIKHIGDHYASRP